MWGCKRLLWQPGKWSLLRMVFFPNTDPPLRFITSSGSFGIDVIFYYYSFKVQTTLITLYFIFFPNPNPNPNFILLLLCFHSRSDLKTTLWGPHPFVLLLSVQNKCVIMTLISKLNINICCIEYITIT